MGRWLKPFPLFPLLLTFSGPGVVLKILFIGDIIGRPGRQLIRDLLPRLVDQHMIDLVIANGENAAAGFGLTPDVYRQPVDATTARVFSDPPMNFLKLIKSGDQIFFEDRQSASATGRLLDLPDDKYLAGFRPNHVKLDKGRADSLEFITKLAVTELTGSETFIHLNHQEDKWVGLINGVHNLELGIALSVYIDPRHIYIFSENGDLVAPAAYALAD